MGRDELAELRSSKEGGHATEERRAISATIDYLSLDHLWSNLLVPPYLERRENEEVKNVHMRARPRGHRIANR